ncbi:MAG: alpha/beta hydrolase [Bacteroidales bacterium]
MKTWFITALIGISISLKGQQAGRASLAIPPSEAISRKAVELTFESRQSTLRYAPDVVYATRGDLNLHLQIVSGRAETPMPCLVYIQGSAWMKQNVYGNLPQLILFAQRGFAVAVVEYRPSDVAPFPAQVQDARSAVRFLRKNAERYNLDPDNIFLWGDSSGGHTAVFAGITSGMPVFDAGDYPEFSDEVNAIVDYYGPTDVSKMNDFPSSMDHVQPDSPEGKLLGGVNVLENLEMARRASPMTYIRADRAIPPLFIAHGDVDALVPFNQSDLLALKLEKEGKDFEFYLLKGADHGTAEFWSDPMFARVEAFLRRNMRTQ